MLSQQIRDHLLRKYVQSARRRKQATVEVCAGDVHRELGLYNSVPSVCQALRSKKFEQQSNARLLEFSSPPSGLSTTTTFRFEMAAANSCKASVEPDHPVGGLEALWGIGREVFRSYGGGEAYLRQGRAAWGEPTPTDR